MDARQRRRSRGIVVPIAASIGLVAWLVFETREGGAQHASAPTEPAPREVLDADAPEPVASRVAEHEALVAPAQRVVELLRVEVVDLARAQIADASVFTHVPGREDVLAGVTGADGTIEIEGMDGLRACRAVAKGFAGETVRVIEGETRLVIALERSASFSGIVLENGAPRAGATVLALDSADMAALEELEDVAPSIASAHDDGSPPAPCSDRATTNTDGRFELTGLAPTRRDTLVALADDAFARAAERGLRPPRANVELVLHPVFAADVRWVDEHGAPVVVDPALRSNDSLAFDARFETPEWDPIDGALVRLVSREPLGRLDDLSRFLLVVTPMASDAPSDGIGPFELGRKLPGYEPATVDVFARATRERTFARETHVLHASSERCGDVRVRLRLATPESGSSLIDGGYTLRLDRRDGTSSEWSVPATDGDHVIRHVAFGAYDAIVFPRGAVLASAACPASSIQVGERESLVTADFTHLGRVEVTIERAPGIPYDGPVMLQLGRCEPGEPRRLSMRNPIRFAHAPYVIDAVPPGDYAACILDPVVRDAQRFEKALSVIGTELARCTFVVE